MLNSQDKQNLIYLVILLCVLALPLLFRRDFAWRIALKYLVMWALVAFAIIALYSYRFEFTDFKNRILGEINPTRARLDHDSIIINIARDGHFYIDTKINEKPLRFMIDTGASDIVIDREMARDLDIDTKNLIFNKRYETANGETFGADVILQKMEIAGVEFRDLHASVNSADLGTPLLGMSFLRKFSRYEFYQDRLELTP